MTVTRTYTDPSEGGSLDRDTGQTLREVDWDGVLSNFKYMAGTTGYIAGHVTKSATQSITNAANTVLTFNQESFDTDGMHDNVTDNSKFTIQTDGVYLVVGLIEYAANATGVRRAVISKSSSAVRTVQVGNQGAGDATQVMIVDVISCVASNTLELLAHQTSGGALNVQATNTFFAIAKV